MALFGFGKKKQQPEPQKPKPISKDIPFILVNGELVKNSNYEEPKIEPVAAPVTTTNSSGWSESVENFLARNSDAKQVKLGGKPDDIAIYSVGNRCHVEVDEENNERYNVTYDGFVIGRLPASAVTYAEKHDCDPEFLSVIISEIEYDYEKERDIISVYISD